MTTLKTLLLASLVSTAAFTSANALAWGEGSQVDSVNGVITNVETQPYYENGYRPAPQPDYVTLSPVLPRPNYVPPRPNYSPPHAPYDPNFDRERREYSMNSRRIDNRQHRQASRIENAFKDGMIGRHDYYRLKAEQNEIHRAEAAMKSDMRLSRREIAELEDMLDEASDNIRATIDNPRPTYRYSGYYERY